MIRLGDWADGGSEQRWESETSSEGAGVMSVPGGQTRGTRTLK